MTNFTICYTVINFESGEQERVEKTFISADNTRAYVAMLHKCEDVQYIDVINGMGWGMTYNRKYLKLRGRRWWDCNRGFWGGNIRTYLIEKFEMEGFEKIVGNTYDQWAEITFKLIEK